MNAFDTTQTLVSGAYIDAAGHYSISDLPAGEYKLEFFAGFFASLHQWAHQKQSFEEADIFTVVAGSTTVVDEIFPPTGTIGGTLTSASGPIAGIYVSAQPLGPDPSFGHGTTDEQGRFEMPLLLPGDYRVSFDLSNGTGGVVQYYPGQVDPNKAGRVTVVAGQRTEIADTLLPTGSASGRIVEDGAGVEGVSVFWSHVNGFTSAFAVTDADGRYTIPRLFTGDYRVNIRLPDGRQQWAHGKVTQQAADLFSVTAGAETVVDETILPTGQVQVRAVNELTGQPIASFCAEISELFACTEDGVATFAKVPVGQHVAAFFPSTDEYLSGATAPVEVSAGGTAEVTLRATPAAIITTTVRDRLTGATVEGVCVHTIRLRFARFPDAEGGCSDAEGRVRMGSLEAGTYTLFAIPRDGVHGMQWVGETGGTGSQFAARQLTVEAGQTVNVPSILLDPAGSISGQITDKITGARVADANVALLTNHPGVGQVGPNASTDADGRYMLTNLGPYEWPLFFSAFGYASHWSGGMPSRLVAKPVKVRAGKTAIANAVLTTGTTIRGTISVAGEPAEGSVIAYEAVTGDIVGTWGGVGSTYDMKVFGPTAIRLGLDTGTRLQLWYRNAADFDHATVVDVPKGGTKTVDLIFN